MCFFFGLPSSPAVIRKRYQRDFDKPELFVPSERYNGFAHPFNAVITNDKRDCISMAQWGLLPAWATNTDFARNTLNARIETVTNLPSFRDAIAHRCLVPAQCFYEWRHEGKSKIPFTIVSDESELFSFAGLYNDWVDPETGIEKRTYTLLTTQASPTMAYIHNTKMRMPVVLHPQDEEAWLNMAPLTNFAYPYAVRLVGFEMKS